jgi:hypothetical protein
MTNGNANPYLKGTLLAGLLASSIVAGTGVQADAQDAKLTAPAATAPKRRIIEVPHSDRAEMYRLRRFGVDHLHVRSISSGASLEFRYRVVDPDKAQMLSDKRAKPFMIDQTTGHKLPVPTMEKIGELRQTATPELGREYWMVFSNPGKLVKPGQRVDVMIGPFRAESLTVE